MLFNSTEFIFLFLPLVVVGYYVLQAVRHRYALYFLLVTSLFFYGWWNPAYLVLLLGSMLFNGWVGSALRHSPNKYLLYLGVAANLGLLGYYKYTAFFLANLNLVAGTGFSTESIVLPLAISFFTFQQIAYLVDAYQGKIQAHGPFEYGLFVCFFPQLIAGPIVHHREMLPQFLLSKRKMITGDLLMGSTLFSLGLFKKTMIADRVAKYANPVFGAAETGTSLGMEEAWIGALAYTLQLYFDFSGYSDMAIGGARLFGIHLPINFNSPYKAANIISFWRRWHITLSRFLRDYLYIPLGGNRSGNHRKQINILITMLLGGLWHGAGWNFVIWGALHGGYLVVNHLWQQTRIKLPGVLSIGLTFTAVVFAWVFFRADSFEAAAQVTRAMLGFNGLSLVTGVVSTKAVLSLAILLTACWVLPNVQEICNLENREKRVWQWQPSRAWATVMGVVTGIALVMVFYRQNEIQEFLYFNF